MTAGELKNKIDGLWDTFTAGGLKNLLDVIEQMPCELAAAIVAVAVIAAILAVIIIIVKSNKKSPTQRTPRTYKPWIFETPERRAGRRGEMIATDIIKGVLRDGDYLLTNVSISYDGRPAELDNVVVNKYGVFIIEVKNYKGRLCGEEDDYTWEKYKDDGYGNTFVMEVKNPIKQVKRQIYILAKYLESFHVWVEGYAFLIQGNSPVQSKYVFESIEDIDRAIHTFGRNHLSVHTVESIRNMLSGYVS